jgi:DNA-binding beta-propeller fold protein YncE
MQDALFLLKKTGQKKPRCSNVFFNRTIVTYFCSLATILFISVTPAFGIRLTPVQHLFDIAHDFNRPSDVSVSAEGQIYVVDGVNNMIKIFDRNGKFVSSFGKKGSRDSEFNSPLGIDVDRHGKVYIADSGNHRLQIFDRRGNFIAKIEIPFNNDHPADPTDVAVDEDRNRCYIVDNDNHLVLAYDLATLKLIATHGRPGTQEREFRYPFLITLDKTGSLYVVDVINTRVQVLNPEGLFVSFVGGWGVEKGHFFRPKGVAIDKEGRAFVSDSYLGVIQVFDSFGDFYAVVADTANGAVKKFKTPTGIYIDHNNRLYVVEMLANRVSVFSLKNVNK